MDTPAAHALVASEQPLNQYGQSGQSSGWALARHQLGRALALYLLAEAAPGPWAIETTSNGKPIAVGDMERHISISHTDAVVAAAVSAIGPVGIDIERRNPARDVVSLAEVAFGPAEAAAVEVEGIAAFYRIWTVREAISKATGEGLAAVADKSDRVPIRMADGTWTLCQGNYLVAHDLIYEEVSLALAVQLLSNDAAEAMRETHVARSRVRVEQSKRTS